MRRHWWITPDLRARTRSDLPEDLPLIEATSRGSRRCSSTCWQTPISFAPEGSVVRIGAEAHDSRVLCWVEDEGPGPAAAKPIQSSARFQRDPRKTRTRRAGTRLWIVKSIIDRHAGTITLVARSRGGPALLFPCHGRSPNEMLVAGR